MKLTFLGAAREVTGSSYLLEADGVRFLVDCGMFQGGREADEKNRRAIAYDPATLDFVILTHAHIDHSGLLPRLVALGFKGTIHATRATCDLLAVMLPDSAHIQEKEVEYQNRNRFRHGMAKREGEGESRTRMQRETAPLYTVAQAQASLKRLNPVDYDLEIAPHPKVRCTFRDAGHIIGSAIVEVWVGEGARRRKIVFSGDLGQPARPLLRDPAPIFEADYLVVESTYGNRDHKSMEATQDELVEAINDTIERKGGNVVIPSFAVGRTQTLLYFMRKLMEADRIPPVVTFVDSPMAIKATQILSKHSECYDAEAKARELLNLAAQNRNDAMYGDAVFEANNNLGKIALRRGDKKAAVRYMLAAADTPGSDRIRIGQFDMNLQRSLVDWGERSAVAEFLERMAPKTARSKQFLDWAAEIRKGVNPEGMPTFSYPGCTQGPC